MSRTTTRLVIFSGVALGIVLLAQLWLRYDGYLSIPYSEFEGLLEQRAVVNLVVTRDEVRGEFKRPRDGHPYFVTRRIDPALLEDLQGSGLQYRGESDNTIVRSLLSWIVPLFLLVGLWFLVMKRMQPREGGFLAVGKSKAKVYVETDTHVLFSDVAGVNESKAELEEIVEFLKNREKYMRLGARMPKGVLLVGPPGTGKTLLARAVAGEAHVPFFSISGSEFVEMFVGVGAARVRDLFEQARERAPCIIFIDELDALGKARSSQPTVGGHDEKEQTLNQLLVELDGFDAGSGIVLLGATNRPEILDPALLRAGRFDRQVLVDRPDKIGRIEILNVHLRKIKIAEGTDASEVADLTVGFSGADLANLVNEAALLATRRDAAEVEIQDFTAAIERIVSGLEKRNRLLNPREREIVAHHEMGHAIVSAALPGHHAVHKVSIVPRGIGALGYTLHRPTEDRFLMTREELENKLAALLGGRAAEHVVYGHLSTAASDDLAQASEIARSMVTCYAMAPDLGNATYEQESQGFLDGSPGIQSRSYSEQTAREIDCAIRALVDRSFERAVSLLQRNRVLLDASARKLLEHETLDEAELLHLFEKVEPELPGALGGGRAALSATPPR